MKRRPYSILPPKPKRRRYWTVVIRPTAGRRVQRSVRSGHRAAAKEYAIAWLRQDFPALCALIDQRPLIKPTL